MSSSEVTKTVTLGVEAEADVSGGLAEVRTQVRRTLDEIDRDASARIQASRAAIETARSSANTTSGNVDAFKALGNLKTLKENLGEESKLGQTLKAFKGAGAVAALALGADLAAKITDHLRDATVEYSLGKKSAGEITEELVQQLPILGNIYKTVFNIADVFSGTAAMVAKINEEAAREVTINKAVLDTLKSTEIVIQRLKDARQGIADDVTKQIADRLPADLKVKILADVDVKAARKVFDDIAKAGVADLKDASKPGSIAQQLAEAKARHDAIRDPTAPKMRDDGGADYALEVKQYESDLAAVRAERAKAKTAADQLGTLIDNKTEEINAKAKADGDAKIRAIQNPEALRQAVLSEQVNLLREEASLGDVIKGFEADRLAITQKYNDAAAALLALQHDGATEAERQDATARLAALKDRQASEQADVDRRQRDAERDRQATSQTNLIRLRADQLRDEAAVGDRLKAFDAERLDVAQRFLELRRQLQATIANPDPNASGYEKFVAQKTLDDLPARQRAAEAEVDRRKANAARDEQITSTAELNKITIDQLETQSALGNRQAEIEAKRLEIGQKYVEQQRDLDDLLQKQKQNGEDTARTEALRASLKQRQRAELNKMLRDEQDVRAAPVDVDQNLDVSVYAARARDDLDRFTEPPATMGAQWGIGGGIGASSPPPLTSDAIAAAVHDALGDVLDRMAQATAATGRGIDQLVDKLASGGIKVVGFPKR